MIRLTFTFLLIFGVFLPVHAGENINFNAAVFPYSAFKIKRLKAAGKPVTPPPGTELSGELFSPAGKGPFPAIVFSHDCRGVQEFQKARARTFAMWGYQVLQIDSYSARGVTGNEVCANLLEWQSRDVVAGRTLDIYGALAWLSARSDIDKSRLYVIGWDIDTTLSSIAKQGVQSIFPNVRIKAAVAVTPDCALLSSGEFITDLLVITAKDDDWLPAANCIKMAKAAEVAGSNVTLQILDAMHGFDDDKLIAPLVIADAFNPYKNQGSGATFQYNETAADKSLELIKAFLNSH